MRPKLVTFFFWRYLNHSAEMRVCLLLRSRRGRTRQACVAYALDAEDRRGAPRRAVCVRVLGEGGSAEQRVCGIDLGSGCHVHSADHVACVVVHEPLGAPGSDMGAPERC